MSVGLLGVRGPSLSEPVTLPAPSPSWQCLALARATVDSPGPANCRLAATPHRRLSWAFMFGRFPNMVLSRVERRRHGESDDEERSTPTEKIRCCLATAPSYAAVVTGMWEPWSSSRWCRLPA
jgi:hypothetical protein